MELSGDDEEEERTRVLWWWLVLFAYHCRSRGSDGSVMSAEFWRGGELHAADRDVHLLGEIDPVLSDFGVCVGVI